MLSLTADQLTMPRNTLANLDSDHYVYMTEYNENINNKINSNTSYIYMVPAPFDRFCPGVPATEKMTRKAPGNQRECFACDSMMHKRRTQLS